MLEPAVTEPPATEVEVSTCRCGQPFERQVVVIDGRRIAYPHCNACSEAILEEGRVHAESIREAYSGTTDPLAKLQVAGVNVRVFGHLKLEDMGKAPAAEAARSFVRQALRAKPYEFVQGLYLAGGTGVGKTQLAVSTLRALLEGGYRGRVVFDRARALITTIQDRYGTGGVDAVIDARRAAGVWLLDDIGTEKPTPDAFRILEDILDARQGHPTILTSNLDVPDLAEHWAPQDTQGRLASRLGPENYRGVVMEGEDRRLAERSGSAGER